MASSSTLLSQIRERRNMVRAHHILPPHFYQVWRGTARIVSHPRLHRSWVNCGACDIPAGAYPRAASSQVNSRGGR